MPGRRSFALSTLALIAACAQPAPPPPLPVSAPVPAPPPTLSQRVRQEGWITRFWEQLTPSQRRRVLRRMQRGDPPKARTQEEAAPVWDSLGLPERDALVFGPLPPRAPARQNATARSG